MGFISDLFAILARVFNALTGKAETKEVRTTTTTVQTPIPPSVEPEVKGKYSVDDIWNMDYQAANAHPYAVDAESKTAFFDTSGSDLTNIPYPLVKLEVERDGWDIVETNGRYTEARQKQYIKDRQKQEAAKKAEEERIKNAKPKFAIISTKSDVAIKWNTHYKDEYKIDESLELLQRTSIYYLIEGVYENSFRVAARNIRGQDTHVTHRPAPVPQGEPSEYEAGWFKAPSPNGWSIGEYDIMFLIESIDGDIIYDSVTIPAKVIYPY